MRQTDKTIEAMKQALDALELGESKLRFEAIAALHAAITEASMQRLTDVQQKMKHIGDANKMVCREWVGLTDEEKLDLAEGFYSTDIVRIEAVEAMVKEKNHD